MKMFDLGDTPSMPTTISKAEKRKPYYPSLYVKGCEDLASLAAGKVGKATIEFEIKRQSTSEEGGKKSFTTEIDVRKIGVEGAPKAGGSLCTRCAHKTPGAYCSNCGSKKGD